MPYVVPKEDDLRRAAAVFNDGSRVAILVGAGALGAADEIIEVADLLGAGVAKALLRKATDPSSPSRATAAQISAAQEQPVCRRHLARSAECDHASAQRTPFRRFAVNHHPIDRRP